MNDDQAGKGDKYRPIDRTKWSENYDRIFMTTEQKIDALVNDLDNWDDESLLEFAKGRMRADLYSQLLTDQDVHEEYHRFIKGK